MQVFINEKSLHGQFSDHTIAGAMKTFISAVKTINDLQIDKRILTTKYFFNFNAIGEAHLDSILSSHKELKQTFFLNIKNASKWEDEMTHDLNSTYTYNESDYVTTSVAELSERKIQSELLKGFSLNFTNSLFAELLQIDVIKGTGNRTVTLDCSFDEDSVIKWLIDNEFINPNEAYNTASRATPRDYQTVLRDTGTFEPTELRNQGRKVYRRIGTNELWVVDNFHNGSEAHIEVFHEETRKHLGTSPIGEIKIEDQYKDPKKTLH